MFVCFFDFVAHQGPQLTTTNNNASSATRIVCYFYEYNLSKALNGAFVQNRTNHICTVRRLL